MGVTGDTGPASLSSVPFCMKDQRVTKIRAHCWGSGLRQPPALLPRIIFLEERETQGYPSALWAPLLLNLDWACLG